jgi:hypothetical protein
MEKEYAITATVLTDEQRAEHEAKLIRFLKQNDYVYYPNPNPNEDDKGSYVVPVWAMRGYPERIR